MRKKKKKKCRPPLSNDGHEIAKKGAAYAACRVLLEARRLELADCYLMRAACCLPVP